MNLTDNLFHSSSLASTGDAKSVIHTTPLGFLQPRSGGLPMRLSYFIKPADLLKDDNTAMRECT